VVRTFGAPFRLPPVNSDVRRHMDAVTKILLDMLVIGFAFALVFGAKFWFEGVRLERVRAKLAEWADEAHVKLDLSTNLVISGIWIWRVKVLGSNGDGFERLYTFTVADQLGWRDAPKLVESEVVRRVNDDHEVMQK
jgi:hypothetical protein